MYFDVGLSDLVVIRFTHRLIINLLSITLLCPDTVIQLCIGESVTWL